MPSGDRCGSGQDVAFGIRPEALEDARCVPADRKHRGVVVRARIDHVETLGSEQLVYVSPRHAPPATVSPLPHHALVARLRTQDDRVAGAEIELWLDPDDAYLFEADGDQSRLDVSTPIGLA